MFASVVLILDHKPQCTPRSSWLEVDSAQGPVCHLLCDLGQVTHPLRASISQAMKRQYKGHDFSFALSWGKQWQEPNKHCFPGLFHEGLATWDPCLCRSGLCIAHRPHSGDCWAPGEPRDAQASGGFCLKAPSTCFSGLPGSIGPWDRQAQQCVQGV